MFWALVIVGAVRALLEPDPRRRLTTYRLTPDGLEFIGYGKEPQLALIRTVEADRGRWVADCRAGRRRWKDFPYAY